MNAVVIRFATVVACCLLAACAGTPTVESPDERDFTLRVEDRDATGGRFMIYDLTGGSAGFSGSVTITAVPAPAVTASLALLGFAGRRRRR